MEPAAKSYLDDGFVFGMEGSGLEQPKVKLVNVVMEGDSLENTPQHLALVSGTFLSHALFSALAIQHGLHISHRWQCFLDGRYHLGYGLRLHLDASWWTLEVVCCTGR